MGWVGVNETAGHPTALSTKDGAVLNMYQSLSEAGCTVGLHFGTLRSAAQHFLAGWGGC